MFVGAGLSRMSNRSAGNDEEGLDFSRFSGSSDMVSIITFYFFLCGLGFSLRQQMATGGTLRQSYPR